MIKEENVKKLSLFTIMAVKKFRRNSIEKIQN